MGIFSKLLSACFSLAALLLYFTPLALAADNEEIREVRVSLIQGDVRLSRGDGKQLNLKKPWEQAQSGELIQQGFALATGNGRAAIEFENGSTVYLAENSLLLFVQLAADGNQTLTDLSLPSGTATFALQTGVTETFNIETATEQFQVNPSKSFFMRIDAFLDGAAITPEGDNIHIINRADSSLPNASLAKHQTVFIRQGRYLKPDDSADDAAKRAGHLQRDSNLSPLPISDELRSSRAMSFPLSGAISKSPSSDLGPIPQRSIFPANEGPLISANDYDAWVFASEQERQATRAAALKASGLPSPIPELRELYAHGNLFPCEPYGTCWEPALKEHTQTPESQVSPQSGKSIPSQNTPTAGFQPQTVNWTENIYGECGFGSSARISRIARTPDELKKLLARKAWAERQPLPLRGVSFDRSCLQGEWIWHNGHYARVVVAAHKPAAPTCLLTTCKPKRGPRPAWVRVAGRVGLVPRHPDDVAGKPPINLKNGIVIPPARSGESSQLVVAGGSERVQILKNAPKDFQKESTMQAPPAAAPEIHAHRMQDFTAGHFESAANQTDSHIVFDYKSQKFVMPVVSAGGKSRGVPVGGIAPNGKAASFAGGHSGQYAASLSHGSSVGTSGSGAHYASPASSGSSYSSARGASSSSTNASSSSGSSQYYSGGSSAGGIGASSASSSSSSSSGSSGGGRPH